MSDIRFLLDENVDILYHTQLLKREPAVVVWRVGTPGAPPKGTPDAAILLWCNDSHLFEHAALRDAGLEMTIEQLAVAGQFCVYLRGSVAKYATSITRNHRASGLSFVNLYP